MKRFENIHNINLIVYAITLTLYITIIYGMLSQMVLGAVQVILAFVLLGNWKKLFAKSQTLISIYFLIVLIYGFTFMLSYGYFKYDYMSMISIFIIPMAIATYFVYVTHQIKQIQNSDKSIQKLNLTTL